MAAGALAARMAKDDGTLAYALDVVLPFGAQEFEKDFADEASRDAFRALHCRGAGGARAAGQSRGRSQCL